MIFKSMLYKTKKVVGIVAELFEDFELWQAMYGVKGVRYIHICRCEWPAFVVDEIIEFTHCNHNCICRTN